MIRGADDLLDDLGIDAGSRVAPPADLPDDERAVLRGPRRLVLADALARRGGAVASPTRVTTILSGSSSAASSRRGGRTLRAHRSREHRIAEGRVTVPGLLGSLRRPGRCYTGSRGIAQRRTLTERIRARPTTTSPVRARA